MTNKRSNVEFTNYGADEAQKVLEEARRELDPYLHPDVDVDEAIPALVAITGEIFEVTVATLQEVEKINDELRSGTDR